MFSCTAVGWYAVATHQDQALFQAAVESDRSVQVSSGEVLSCSEWAAVSAPPAAMTQTSTVSSDLAGPGQAIQSGLNQAFLAGLTRKESMQSNKLY